MESQSNENLNKYYCKICNQYLANYSSLYSHNKSKRHLKNLGITFEFKYNCSKCNYHTNIKDKYERHLTSDKHNYSKEECKSMQKKRSMLKFGVEHSSKNPEVRAKCKQTCMKKYGTDSPMKTEKVKEKLRQTCIEKYGVEYPIQNKEIYDKFRQTCIQKYKVDHPMKNEKIKEKFRKTCLERYGFEYPMQNSQIKAKFKKAIIDKYGVDHPFKIEEIKKRAMEHMKQKLLDKYGVDSPMQIKAAFIKNQNSFERKKYVFPSGNIVYVQGYEPICIDFLLTIYKEEEIEVKTIFIPNINYQFQGKLHTYYPDMIIQHLNKLIEVKSVYWWEKYKDKNEAKFKACVENGYELELFVYDNKKQLKIRQLYTSHGIETFAPVPGI